MPYVARRSQAERLGERHGLERLEVLPGVAVRRDQRLKVRHPQVALCHLFAPHPKKKKKPRSGGC